MTPIMLVSRRVHLILIFLTALWCAGLLLTPVLDRAGTDVSLMRSFYGKVCHQIEPRSFIIGGKPMAVCVRCSAIYAGFLAGSLVGLLVGTLVGSNAYHFGIRLCVIAAGSIVAADVGFDLLGVIPNTVLSRVVSGGFFGVVSALFVIPLFVEAIRSLQAKLKKR